MVDVAKPPRILIVRLSALGDCVHVLPALDALRRGLGASARIGWMVEEKAESLLAGHPQIDRVHVLPRRAARALVRAERPIASLGELRRFFGEVRRERYDVAVDFQSNLRSSLAAFFSGAPTRVGFARGHDKEGSHRLRTRNVVPPAHAVHKVEKNLALAAALGVDVARARSVLRVPPLARERARAFHAASFSGDEPVVALHPGVSRFGAFKRWPSERYAELARSMHTRLGARALVTWGPGELDLAREIAGASGAARAVIAPETSSVLDLAALFQECDAVVGCDTGPVHVAAALGVPLIALYGPKDPAIYAPWSGDGAVAPVWKHVHCSPCRLRWCGNVVCMSAIRVDDVERALGAILERARGPITISRARPFAHAGANTAAHSAAHG